MRWLKRHRRTLIRIILALSTAFLIWYGWRFHSVKHPLSVSDTFPGIAMGTTVKKTIYSESSQKNRETDEAIDACLKELEEKISVRDSHSEVSLLNANYVTGGMNKLSDLLYSCVSRELELCRETDGAFSPCIRPVSELWGIEDGSTQIPEESQIRQALTLSDPAQLELTADGLIFGKYGMKLDFGAVGKGLACDRIVEVLRSQGVQGAVVSVGGSIAVFGDKGRREDWHVGIQDPRGKEGDLLGVLICAGGTMISTSGDYEKYFEQDGKRYHHIFDPATGHPARSGLISVTVVSEDGFLSDALSTACFVMGPERGMEYVSRKGVQAVFVTAGRKVFVTKGLKNKFKVTAKGYEMEFR